MDNIGDTDILGAKLCQLPRGREIGQKPDQVRERERVCAKIWHPKTKFRILDNTVWKYKFPYIVTLF